MTSEQFFAVVLGVICGSIMTAILIFTPVLLEKRAREKGSKFADNEMLPQGIAFSSVGLVLVFIFASIAIFTYNFIAPDTLVWFGIATLAFYAAGFTVYSVQKIVKERKKMDKGKGGLK